MIGLGAGTLAAYGRKGDVLRFYEIDPKAVEMSGRHFSYCRDTPARVNLVLGDARVMLERERNEGQAQGFDVLAVDAFSSDAIPMHLLTRECFDLYWEHLQPDGVLCVHVSNRFLELKPLVEGLALGRGFHALYVDNDEDDVIGADPNGWMLVTRNRAFLEAPEVKRLESKWERPKPMPEPWTDDYASLFSVLKS
ncbi:MAG: fused MFS/spermidine synthase [Planctomycetota bacterium]|nr:fused MFS/spermidine synthase [Planctomycetota bacterium]